MTAATAPPSIPSIDLLARRQSGELDPEEVEIVLDRVEVARTSGLKLSRDQVIFTSPIVLYSWDRIADGLVKGGLHNLRAARATRWIWKSC